MVVRTLFRFLQLNQQEQGMCYCHYSLIPLANRKPVRVVWIVDSFSKLAEHADN